MHCNATSGGAHKAAWANTPGTWVGPGGRDQTQAVISRKTPKNLLQIFFFFTYSFKKFIELY